MPSVKSPSSKLFSKNSIIFVLKLAVASGLIYWLINSGKLDLSKLSLFVERLDVLLITVFIWVVVAVGVGGSRWYILLKGMGLKPKYFRTIHLSMVGLFFNTVMPGAIGGDIIKAIYIFKDQKDGDRASAVMTVILDRVFGMFGLFTVAVVGIVLGYEQILSNKALLVPAALAVAVFLAMTISIILAFYPHARIRALIESFNSSGFIGSGLAAKIYEALNRYQSSRKYLVWAWICSVVVQGSYVGFYWYLTPIITGTAVSFSTIASLVPLGILMTAIPILPGGIGIGHVAFDRLFAIIGVAGGANVFNILFLGQLVMNLFGFFPYLTYKSKISGESLAAKI